MSCRRREALAAILDQSVTVVNVYCITPKMPVVLKNIGWLIYRYGSIVMFLIGSGVMFIWCHIRVKKSDISHIPLFKSVISCSVVTSRFFVTTPVIFTERC